MLLYLKGDVTIRITFVLGELLYTGIKHGLRVSLDEKFKVKLFILEFAYSILLLNCTGISLSRSDRVHHLNNHNTNDTRTTKPATGVWQKCLSFATSQWRPTLNTSNLGKRACPALQRMDRSWRSGSRIPICTCTATHWSGKVST